MDLSQETDENLMMRFGRGEAAAFELKNKERNG